MKISKKTVLLILLVVIFSFSLISCAKTNENPIPIIEDDQDNTSPVINMNKNQLMRKISDGLLSGAETMDTSTDRFVNTIYTIHTGYINYTIEYKANYASKKQNSQIFVKIFDNNENKNRIFLYYDKGNLFIQSQDEKKSIKDFGVSSMFDLFYETVMLLDMSPKLISQNMSELFDPNVPRNIGGLIDQSRMKYIKVTNTAESIEMTNVNLSYGDITKDVNAMIKNTFIKFEKKFDLLSLKYLGLRISDLAFLEIANMQGDMINVRLEDGDVQTVIFEASGMMTDRINTFTLDLLVEARPGKGVIEIDDTENPYLQNYPEVIMGRYNYGGKLYVPFLDMTYDATLRTILSSTDNTKNEVVFTIESVYDEMGGLFYKDQMLYVDISGIQNQLNGAVELEKLNLPKIKFDNIDLAQEITLLINDVLKIVQSFAGEDEYGENEEMMNIVLDNIVSNEEDNTISITITTELIQALYGEDVDLMQLIAEKLGVAPELIAQLFGDDALADARLVLIYNVENGDIGVDLFDGETLIFELRLSPIDPLPGDHLIYPDSFNPDYHYWLEVPDNTILSLQGSLSMQEVSRTDFSSLFGALFGDITGLNTPYILNSNEILNFNLDIMQVYDYTEDTTGDLIRTIESIMKFEVFKADVLQFGVYSSSDPNYLLVHFNVPIGPAGVDNQGNPYAQKTLKYRIERQKVKDAFDELLGEDNIFSMTNIMDVFSRLLQSVNESISMQLRFIDSSFAFNLISDTVKDIIGIDNLNALIKARIRFAMTPEEYLNVNIIENEFVDPNVRPLENQRFESIYTTKWQEFVYTYFGDDLMRLKLSYMEDSVRIVSGKYYYQPKAKILDEIVSYYVTIEDSVNGIKVVQDVLDPELPQNMNAVINVDNPLRIDPSKDVDLPQRLPVYYDDGTFGYVKYIVEGFDVSNINVSGMPKAEYWLIIGKGSVAELRFYIAVEVLGRIIIPIQEIVQGEAVYMKSNLGEPVVDEITIDPYSYAVRKTENPFWTPIKTSLTLRFESIDGENAGDSIYINQIDWDFDFDNIQYNGGVFFTHAWYNRLRIALKINIKSKIVSYLRFIDVRDASLPIDQRPLTEGIGQYTVDVLETSTYTFPTGSTESQELRLYFEDGTYRIIGTKNHAIDDINYYNSYLPLVLDWKHPTVNQSSIRLIGTKAPLGIEDTNINSTVIGGDNFMIGNQDINLTILMPSRAEGTIGTAGTIFATTGYNKLENGEYDFAQPIREHSPYTNASFNKNQPLGSFFEFNPYNQQPLPPKVFLEVIQGGEYRYQRKGYAVKWLESDVLVARDILDGQGNIIKTGYFLRNVSTDEEYLLVKGILGDGDATIEVRMIVKNIEAVYQDITFEGMDANVTNKIIDPYLNYNLPSYYTLLLKNGNEIVVEKVQWYIILDPSQDWMLQLRGKSYHWLYYYLEYRDAIDKGLPPSKQLNEILPAGVEEPNPLELEYYRLLLEKGEIPIDNRFIFSHTGGNFVLKSYIEATDSVISQEVYLTINVLPRTVLITDSENDYTQMDIYNTSSSVASELFSLDTYQIESTVMLDRLEFLYRMNNEYDNTIKKFNNIYADIRLDNEDLDYIAIYALSFDRYRINISEEEKNYLVQFYTARYNLTPNATPEEIKYYALQDYLQEKNNFINQIKVGMYFGDNPETSTQKYLLLVYWTNISEIISALSDSSGAVLGITLEGYIGYGQINQQLIRVPFRIARREIVSMNFSGMSDYDPSVMSVDYRYVYISDVTEAVSLINNIKSSVMNDSSIAQHDKSYTIFTRLKTHASTTDNDVNIMEYVEESVYHADKETRYSMIIDELLRIRQENMRTIFIDMYKPMGLTQYDAEGDRIFLAPSQYFYDAFSQVSLIFADGTEGYYAPRFVIGEGNNLEQRKYNFDSRLLATDPSVYEVIYDPVTERRYAYLTLSIVNLSAGSCKYPITIKFKAVVDQKGVVDGYPSEGEIDPFDENGNPRFLQGYRLPQKVTINYDYSGPVTFGNISNWHLASPLYGFEENDSISLIPANCINILDPSIIDLRINLPCSQGEYTYHVSFPQKYIGKTKYNGISEDRAFSQLDIKEGVIEIDNLYEIYDPSKPQGFDINKLPQIINPYTYEYGEVQFDIGMSIDAYFEVTNNNSFVVEWSLADEWRYGRKIDSNGTIVNISGEFIVAPILFATARLYSYYYNNINSQQPILLEQEIELYIKVKPMLNPIIEYEGLVNFDDSNHISFDPYVDPNNYGGNLSLPKNGLKVYFNNNTEDYHVFDARAILNYNLLMSDSDIIAQSYLYDALISRSNTPSTEKIVYQKLYIEQIIQQYAVDKKISLAQANEFILALAYNAILESANLPMVERERQRRFLIDYSFGLLSQNYHLSSLSAWNKLMQTKTGLSDRRNILIDYLLSFENFNITKIIQDIDILLTGYNSMFVVTTETTQQTKNTIALIIDIFSNGLRKSQKVGIIKMDSVASTYEQDITAVLGEINSEGVLTVEEDIYAEAYSRLILRVDTSQKLNILKLYIQADPIIQTINSQTGIDSEDISRALLYRELIIAVKNRNELINSISEKLASTIGDWTEQNNTTVAGIWEIHLAKTIERASYESILFLVDLYMSSSEDFSVSRFKEIIINHMLTVFQFNEEDLNYFNEDGDIVQTTLLSVIISGTVPQLPSWRMTRAKSNAWETIKADLETDNILTRIIIGEDDQQNTGSLNTQAIKALSYERLKQSSILAYFIIRLNTLEQQINLPNPNERKAEIFTRLYEDSLLTEKVMLIEIMMKAARNVSDSSQSVSVIPYTQAGHSIAQISQNVLYLYLLLPDGQSVDIVLDIFSREIREVLVPNVITNNSGSNYVISDMALPNIYYIDPYNSQTFRLPEKAEFVFETGYNLILDIDEWIFDDEELFYTRSVDAHKLFYYKVSENSYRGGIYEVTSYLTYGTGALAEKQYFTITLVVLNRTLKEEYNRDYDFDNPISGRLMDIPYQLTEDMFVDADVYYKSVIPAEYYYSNFGKPIVPHINWQKTAINTNGITDADIDVQGGFAKTVQGYLYYENSLILNTYNQIWQNVYTQYAEITKPMAWSMLFEISISGERIVKTVFAGTAAEQISTLDKQIYNDLYIAAYLATIEYAQTSDITLLDQIEALLRNLRNNNFGLYPDESREWFILLYKELAAKANNSTLTLEESNIWQELYGRYLEIGNDTLDEKRAQKWDELMAMSGVFTNNQRNIAVSYLDNIYLQFRNTMLITAWDNLERIARQEEAEAMAEIISSLRNIYGSIEQAKIRAWAILKLDDRVKGVYGESATVDITADSWNFVDLVLTDINDEIIEIINEITFNAFTQTTNDVSFDAVFETINTILAERLNGILYEYILEHYDMFKKDALNSLKAIIMQEATKELDRINAENYDIINQTSKEAANWDDLFAIKTEQATSPIDNTRQEVEDANAEPEFTENNRDEIVWIRLLEGAGEWLDYMLNSQAAANEMWTLAVDEYRQARLTEYTSEMNEIYVYVYDYEMDETYNKSVAWQRIYYLRELIAYNEFDYIDSIYLQKKEENLKKYYAWAYNILIEDDDLIRISQEYDANDLKSYLWSELYDSLDSNQREVMNSVFNTIKRESGITDDEATAIGWDVLFNKSGISQQTKQRMQEMYDTNFNAEVYLIYCDWYVENSYSAITYFQECFEKSQVWDSYYNSLPESHEIRSLMDNILIGYVELSYEISRANAFDDLVESEGMPEQQADMLRVMLNNFEIIEIMEKTLLVNTFEYLYSLDEYRQQLQGIYDDLLQAFVDEYPTQTPETDDIKGQAVVVLKQQLISQANDDIALIMNQSINALSKEIYALTWDVYYQHNLIEKPERALVMEDILYQSVIYILDQLKENSVDTLYNKLNEEAVSKVEKIREDYVINLQKETIWLNYFGEEIDSIKNILNNILAVDENEMSIKHDAWGQMINSLSDSSEDIDIRQDMVSVRETVSAENKYLTNKAISALAFDVIINDYANIAERLMVFVYQIKAEAWNQFLSYYSNNDIMTALLNEMYNLELYYHDNYELYSKYICWNRMVGMTEHIDETLATIDPRFSMGELKAIAIDCILESLRATERSILLNEILLTDINLTENQINSAVFDIILSNSIPEEIVFLNEMYEEAQNQTESTDPIVLKAFALNLYIQSKKSNAVRDINKLAQEKFNKEYNLLSNLEKRTIFTALNQTKQTSPQQLYTFSYAEQQWDNGNVDINVGRMNIFWDQDALDNGLDIANIYIGNLYKNYNKTTNEIDYQNNVFTGQNYLYKTRQIQVDYLDFYGQLNRYSGEENDAVNYYNQLVIDPLNPYIPEKVDAYGTITGVPTDTVIDGIEYTYIGKVSVSFDSRIYDFLYDEQGENGEIMTARVSPGFGEGIQNVTIKVFYLNRKPIAYYVNSNNYTLEQRDDELMLYPLSLDNLTGNRVLTLDPLNDNIYDYINERYTLPNSMVLMFSDSYVEEIITTLFMNDIFQNRLDITNISWNLLGNDISLEGLSAASISIDTYVVNDAQIESTTAMNADFWKIQLDVMERSPERILQVNQQGLAGTTFASMVGNNMTVSNKIDPYNVMISFPSNVRIEFLGGSEAKVLTGITWKFEEGRGLEFLQLPEVITGTIGENAMYLTAGFKCVSQTIWVNFPIQERHIDTSEGKLLGGDIYLIKGVNKEQQLARYNSLYYNFADFGQTADWSEVPLEFSQNEVAAIDIDKIGMYTLTGRLGPINDLNILFNVNVIDPKLYATDLSGAINPKVYYDTLSVAINNFGIRISGKEDEQGFLPDNLVQFGVTDENANTLIGYNEFTIINKHWDIGANKVVFTCLYTFLSENDDIELLAGNSNGSKELTFTVSIPLQTYLYTEVDDSIQLKINSKDGTSILKLPLGEKLLMSQLPKAVMNKGTEDEYEITLLWDLSSINVNKAGTYNIYGYYRDYTSSYLVKSKNLVIVIDKIDISQQISTVEQLMQTYTGLYIEITPILPDVLRENGVYTQLRLGREVIVEYLSAEKYELGEFGDFRTTPFKDAGEYRVRITINDYNISGQKVFALRILPIEIDPNEVVFDYGAGASIISVNIPNWPGSIEAKNRMYYEQFRIMANQQIGSELANRAKAAAYDELLINLNNTGQALLNDRYITLLELTFPNYYDSEEAVRINMRRVVKVMVWEEITPTGLTNSKLVPQWPKDDLEKEELLNIAKGELEQEEIEYNDNLAMAWAFDNLYLSGNEIVSLMLGNRLNNILVTRFPEYDYSSEAIKVSMLIEAKAIVWTDIIPTGFYGTRLISNWPITNEEKEQLLDVQYDYLLDITYGESEREFFRLSVRARAYDTLYLNVYTTAQIKLAALLNNVIQLYYPLFNTYNEQQQELIIIEAKAMVWDDISPGDTVDEKSYVYDGFEHMPVVSGLPQAKIIGWPQNVEQKQALLDYASNENINFTPNEAKARAYDNLTESIYSNVHALQKITDILNKILRENYPNYFDQGISYEERQNTLIEAKARAWDNRILPGDTVEEINYSFDYWYANMSNQGMVIYSRPKDAGTYEITLIIDPSINKNYKLKGDAPIITTINIRRAAINQTFANQMTYQGKPILPICLGLHDENATLPLGVTIEYSFMQNGQEVSYIKDVGQYTFSATINGGNNYPSWTIQDQVLNITEKDLTIDVGTVTSGYLEKIKEINSSVAINGIVGNDIPSMFGYIVCESDVTSKHMVGDYPINFVGFKESYQSQKIYYLNASVPADDVMALDSVLFGNYNITIINGIYRIEKANEKAITISSEAELQLKYEELEDGDTVTWYLSPGNYGDFIINKNVGITIIGCYDVNITENDYSNLTDNHEKTMARVKDDGLSIVTYFNSITLNKGALTLDIIRINGQISKSIIYIGKDASALDIKNSAFVHTVTQGEGGVAIPQNSSAINTSPSYKGLIRVQTSYVEGFTAGVYMSGGNKLEIVNCRFNKNMSSVRCFGGDIHIEGSRFEFTRNVALYLEMIDFTTINCSFIGNETAIKSMSNNTYDLWLENSFSNNVTDVSRL